MHPVNIGIGSNHDIVVTQVFQTVFNIECRLQQIKLFVFINHFFGQSVRINRFTTQAKYGLCINITRFGNGTARRIPFGNKQSAFKPVFFFQIVVMHATVAQFFVVQTDFFSAFAG